METVSIVLLAAMLGYFLKRLDVLERKLDRLEDLVRSLPRRATDKTIIEL